VERAVRITARAFNDLVRRTTNLGKRNAGDPWLNSQPMTLTTSPTQTLDSGVTAPVGNVTSQLYQPAPRQLHRLHQLPHRLDAYHPDGG
jgi:hypothetical protein